MPRYNSIANQHGEREVILIETTSDPDARLVNYGVLCNQQSCVLWSFNSGMVISSQLSLCISI